MQTGATRLERLREGEDESEDDAAPDRPRSGLKARPTFRTHPSEADTWRRNTGEKDKTIKGNDARSSGVRQKNTRGLYIDMKPL